MIKKDSEKRIQKVLWKDIRDRVQEVNPEIVANIDSLDPGEDLPLLRVRYYFGEHILRDGVWHLPTDDEKLLPWTDSRIPSDIQQMFEGHRYMGIPIGILLNRSCELYLDIPNHPITFHVITPGRIFSLWSNLQPPETSSHATKVWSISAGTRTLMFVPKISDTAFYKKIQREFDLRSLAPKTFTEQWYSFVELSKHPAFPEPWHLDVLFFPNPWFKEAKKGNRSDFLFFLYKTAWLDTAFLRDNTSMESLFSFALKHKNLKPNPYLTDTAKHLYFIGRGAHPGIVVAHNNEAGPVSAFQSIFMDLYELKYAPTMLHSWHYSPGDPIPCYYSLGLPTLIDFSPKAKQSASKFEDLRELQHINDRLLEYVIETQDYWGLNETPIANWALQTQYDYFHTEISHYQRNILNTQHLPEGDSNLQKELQKFSLKPFCETSPFFRGCVRITSK